MNRRTDTLQDITAERLRELLNYDPATGRFTWKGSRSNRAPNGSQAGYLNKIGYVRIRLDDKLYMASRLAWVYVHGDWPSKSIDHINRDTTDNRIENLREADDVQNQANRGISKNNTSGFKGVHTLRHGKWMASITFRRKSIYLGLFDAPEKAHQAYCDAAKRLKGEFARAR